MTIRKALAIEKHVYIRFTEINDKKMRTSECNNKKKI